MREEILKIKPQNLPVYVYQLDADVAVVHDRIAYKLTAYSFNTITVASNQALRPGDVLTNSCCYYGNEHTEIIPHLHKKGYFGNTGIDLRYYHGCRIDRLAISFVNDNSVSPSCGDGDCTVFIELSDSSLRERIRQLQDRYEKLTQVELSLLKSLKQERLDDNSIEYWKKRIPRWDENFECIGEVPVNLIY